MALEHGLVTISLEAGEDLDTKQYYLVGPDADKKAMLDDGAGPLFTCGPVQNKPKEGEAASVAIAGISKVVLGGTVAAGDPLKTDGSTGKAAKQTSGESFGRVLEAGVDGQIASVLLMRETI
jgi:hypothetical protein